MNFAPNVFLRGEEWIAILRAKPVLFAYFAVKTETLKNVALTIMYAFSSIVIR